MKTIINRKGNWHIYTNTIPAGSCPIGTIKRPSGERGALVKLSTGKYVQINAGCLRTLPQSEIRSALKAGEEV